MDLTGIEYAPPTPRTVFRALEHHFQLAQADKIAVSTIEVVCKAAKRFYETRMLSPITDPMLDGIPPYLDALQSEADRLRAESLTGSLRVQAGVER